MVSAVSAWFVKPFEVPQECPCLLEHFRIWLTTSPSAWARKETGGLFQAVKAMPSIHINPGLSRASNHHLLSESPVPAWPPWRPRGFPAPVLPARARDLAVPWGHGCGWTWTWKMIENYWTTDVYHGMFELICLSIAIPKIWNHQLDQVCWKLLGKQMYACFMNMVSKYPHSPSSLL